MNSIFVGLVLTGFLTVAWQQVRWIPAGDSPSPMENLSKAIVQSAGGSVELAISLIGVMALFLGLMKVAESGGLLEIIARLIRPLMSRLFPEVPPDHPATGAMILNISANLMGLGNAATPFGIRAMQELEKLNPRPGTATNAMVLFVAINTAGITLLPTSVIALRTAAGSANPAGILPTTLFASFCATLLVVVAAKAYQRLFPFTNEAGLSTQKLREGKQDEIDENPGETRNAVQDQAIAAPPAYPVWVSRLALIVLIAIIPLTIAFGRVISPWVIPSLTVGFLAFGFARKVRIYEAFVEGAKEGFQVAVRIIPYLVAILVSIGMVRSSGAIDAAANALGAFTAGMGLPPEGILMAIMRPLSGSGAYGVLASIINDPAIGPDSYTGYLVSTLQGSSETTFYVLAVYFGAVQVKRIRHALVAGLTAEFAAVIAAVAICSYLYG
ncbi:MAG: nucleoside recognition domain-containing protein [Syntrophobacteraceae bacterium]